MSQPHHHTSGFTLVELLMSVTMLAVVISITIVTFLQFTERRTAMHIEQQLYENARFTMERMVREIQESTIDYEEYWNKTMTGGGDFTWYGNRNGNGATEAENNFYFCSSEVDPNNGDTVNIPATGNPTQQHYYYWLDLAIQNNREIAFLKDCVENARHKQLYGQLALLHWNYRQPDKPGEAFTIQDNEELGTSYTANISGTFLPLVTLPQWTSATEVAPAPTFYDDENDFYDGIPAHLAQRELYLINSEGTQRSILRLRANDTCSYFSGINDQNGQQDLCPDRTIQDTRAFLADKAEVPQGSTWIPQYDGAIEKLELLGKDFGLDHQEDVNNPDSDGTQYDGVVDTWVCHPDYNCTVGTPSGDFYIPTERDMGFVPITSPDISIKELRFYVTPIKDPNLAWGEDHPLVQNHPQVRIVMTVIPGYELRRRLKGPVPEVTLVTTVSSRVY